MVRKLLSLIMLLFGSVSQVQAHDPGLSRANVELHEAGMAIHMVYSRQDLEFLMPIDADHDGTVVAEELSVARPGLQSLIAGAVEVRGAKEIHQPKLVRIEQMPEGTMTVDLYYEFSDAAEIRVRIPLIAQLARGHRQYLTVQDASGNLLSQHILDASAVPVILNGSGPDRFSVFREYLAEGIRHIWIGIDHILFLLTLLLPAVLVYQNSGWRSVDKLRPAMTDVLKVVTAFTLAHSITLVLAALDIVSLSPRLVESAIAFSVLVASVNNLRPVLPNSRWLLAFCFGLVHGFGFASVLVELGLPGDALVISLLGFNLGVEAGQLAIVALVFPAMAFLRHTPFYRTWVFSGGSAMAALIAMVWMLERIFNYDVLGF